MENNNDIKKRLNRILIIVFLICLIGLILFLVLRRSAEDDLVGGLKVNNDNRLMLLISDSAPDEFSREITIENTTSEEIVYSVKWIEVENNFNFFEDLTYTLTAVHDGRSVGLSQMPVIDITILEGIIIAPGEVHTYNLNIMVSISESDDENHFAGYLIVVADS